MTLTEIKKIIEKRKYDLIHILKSNQADMDLSKQHQIYGAIQELENTIRILNFHQDEEIRQKIDCKFQNRPRQNIITKISMKLNR